MTSAFGLPRAATTCSRNRLCNNWRTMPARTAGGSIASRSRPRRRSPGTPIVEQFPWKRRARFVENQPPVPLLPAPVLERFGPQQFEQVRPGDVAAPSMSIFLNARRRRGLTMSRLAAIVRASARARPPPIVNERLRSSGVARGIVIWIGCHQFGSSPKGRMTAAAAARKDQRRKFEAAGQPGVALDRLVDGRATSRKPDLRRIR